MKLPNTKDQIMSALDDLLGEFESNKGTMPQVNPPEASKVLATQTAPEVAGQPEPPAVEDAPPAPTEKPAEVKAAEAAKARKPRASKAAPAQAPEGWDNTKQAAAGAPSTSELFLGCRAALLAFQAELPEGCSIVLTITGR
jgi:hypothetical protein